MADKGFTDQVKGKVKEVAGDISGDDKLKSEGIIDQAIGKAKEVISSVKDTTEEIVEKTKQKLEE